MPASAPAQGHVDDEELVQQSQVRAQAESGESVQQEPEVQEQQQTGSSSSSSTPSFIHHKVSSKDTLAGIAIKYNVSVSDIKRFNGLLSDTGIYARDVLLVPTKLYPVGEELQVIFAQVASGFGRDPILNADVHLNPASSAVTRVARSLNLGDDAMFSLQGDATWCCECGGETLLGCGHSEDQRRPSTSCRSHFEPGEVELMERSPDGTMILLPSSSGSGPTRLHDPMRRRRPGGTSSDSADAVHHGCSASWATGVSNGRLSPSRDSHSGQAPAQGPGFSMKQFSKAITDSPWVQRLKAAATQPALANGRMSSLSQTADGVLASIKQGLQGVGADSSAVASPGHSPIASPGHSGSLRRSPSAQLQGGQRGRLTQNRSSGHLEGGSHSNSGLLPFPGIRHTRLGSAGKAAVKSD